MKRKDTKGFSMRRQHQKMKLSANNVNTKINNRLKLATNCESFDVDSDENSIKCQCTTKIIHRQRQTYRGSGYMSSLIVYIYMWITIFAICCSGLPPVIRIGT